MDPATTSAYYDLQGLARLRTQAINTPDDAIDEVASQFESLFVQMMLKSMRDATIEGGLFDSSRMEMYQSMYDQQVSLQLASQGALGLSDILAEQLDQRQNLEPKQDAEADNVVTGDLLGLSRRLEIHNPHRVDGPLQRGYAPAVVPARPTVAGEHNAPAQAVAGWQPSSPEEFIRGVWEHAVNAAGKLGVDPLVLVAQSALETGWGKKVIVKEDGASSFNLFGIKADRDWRGEAATVNTLEYRDGVARLEKASFRAYESLAGSFEDYVDFLQSSPRYQQALAKVADTRGFLHGLQDAGYATDPHYADKILGILGRSEYDAVIDELKKI